MRSPTLFTAVAIALLANATPSASIAQAQPPDTPAALAADGFRLAWSDEFDKDGPPDPAKWDYEHGFVRNDELQWYQPENARCGNGLLVIEARRERVPNPRFDAASRRWQENREFAEFTSASLITRGRADWQYGRFEMRGRLDVRPGLWPAWWTLGARGTWPDCGEIDMMEYYRGMLLANAAWLSPRQETAWDESRTPLADLGGDKWADGFHVWRMDWDESRIALYVDDRLLNEIDLTHVLGRPFHQAHYMILNLAIGGTNGGDPAETKFPAKFEVDYVRVYQKP